jgi:hypothetical protein
MPYKIIKLPNGKFTVVNRVSNYHFSKGSTKKAAIAQMRLLQMKAHEMDAIPLAVGGFKGASPFGAGMTGGTAGDSLIKESMSDEDLHKYFPNVKIYKYNELPTETPVEEFLKPNQMIFILYEQEENEGHWVSMCRSATPDCCFYMDSYGNRPDVPLTWVDKETNARLGQSRKTLTQMFNISKIPVYWNNFDYQNKADKGIATCGRWATSFLIHFSKYGGNLKSFKQEVFKQKRKEKLPLDNLIATKIK